MQRTHKEILSVGNSQFGEVGVAVRRQREQGCSRETPAASLSAFRSQSNNGEDALSRYLRQISVYPLLKPAEESALVKKARRGDNNARRELIQCNLRLVVCIAKKYKCVSVELLDLIQVGNEGLMMAVDRFKLGRRTKLSTYAGYWIRQRMRLFLSAQARPVRVPSNVACRAHRLMADGARLSSVLGREPNVEELCELTGFSERHTQNALSLNLPPMRLDARGNDEDEPLEPCPDELLTYQTAEAFDNTVRWSLLREYMKSLPSRECQIIVMRYGIDGKKPLTLEQVGKKFRVTRERIRQLQQRAEDVLRDMARDER